MRRVIRRIRLSAFMGWHTLDVHEGLCPFGVVYGRPEELCVVVDDVFCQTDSNKSLKGRKIFEPDTGNLHALG